jgi:hypothetical protein
MKRIKNLKVILLMIMTLALLGGVVVFLNKPLAAPSAQIYTDTDYGFSFAPLQGYTASSFSDIEDTKTILVRGSDQQTVTQIFVSAFDEDITLTLERIKEEMPELVILEPQNISLGGVTGVTFRSTNALDTESRELWIVYMNNLYQISLPVQAGVPVAQQISPQLFDSIITTWHWNN